MRILLAGLLVASTALTPLSVSPAMAQSVSLGSQGTAARALSLPKGKSAIIDLPTDARDVLVSNPKVADVVLRTPRRLYVLGTGAGRTDAVFFDGAGRQILSLDIRVGQDVAALSEMVNLLTPGSQVKVESVDPNRVTVPLPDATPHAVRLTATIVRNGRQVCEMSWISFR